MSLVLSTVASDSDVTLECHLCCPLPFTYRGSVLLGRQLRDLCPETELEKRKKKSGVNISLSVLLDKGDRVGKGVAWADCV